jgi:acyl-CoA thioesterase-2
MAGSVDELVQLLDVRPGRGDGFTGSPSGSTRPRLFGGQVLGQALASAGRTVAPGLRPHSLHAYFLQPGDPHRPVDYEVTPLREGRSFSTREVRARQGTRSIFTMTASFHGDEPGLEHQGPAPSAPPPDELPSSADRPEDWPDIYQEWGCLDIRRVPGSVAVPTRARSWLRLAGTLPDDELLHACVLACLSDLTLLSAALVPHGIPPRHEGYLLASLDHAVWFHRPCRVDDWLLYDQSAPSTSNSRGLAVGRLLAADGTLVASVAQEGLLRRERDQP